MATTGASGRARRRSLLLFLALLPMLTFFGHWPEVRIDVPGTSGYWALPFASSDGHAHSHGGPNDSHEHSQHCHVDLGSCLNTTSAAIAFAALLALSVAFIGRDAPLLRGDRDARAVLAGRSDAPQTPPPRLRTSLAGS